ncbi:sensor histidine kinase [Actinomadura rudentiformis]|uniref:histidine kinase n=2 Tax=Actinomadura rudentiformis TaxID=359158 RepID=A0A6H9YD22_9ACTN|nr:sensor histidine kinase [Actinomadura rudentiformis]
MARNPLRFLLSSWPWRSIAYLATGPLVAVGWLAVVLVVGAAGVLLAPLVVGLGLLLFVPLTAIGLAAVERRRLRLLDARPAPSPHREPAAPGWRPWLRLRLREAATWREFGFALLFALLGAVDVVVPFVIIVGSSVQVGSAYLVGHGDQLQYGPYGTVDQPEEAWVGVAAGVAMFVVGLYVMAVLAGARAALARLLLVRPVEDELVAVRASRARMADAFEAERRRIERDLHDGAQQRLTGLIMTLGLARLETPSELIDKAQQDARAALAELRDLVRGIHPSVLTDRGLRAAVESLAEGAPVPVEVDVELPGRPDEGVESAAYFVIAEALANVVKHSEADRARVLVRHQGRLLVVEVRDDGKGGARAGEGSGLQGLADRVAVYDGTLRLASPPGGPTILRVEIPCEL